MQDNAKPIQIPVAETARPAQPNPADSGGKRLVGSLVAVVVLAAVAVYGAVFFRLLPLDFGKTLPPALPSKQVVLFAAAEPFQAGLRPAGSSFLAEVHGDNELNLSIEVGGVIERIGPSANQHWAEGTSVQAGTVLAQLKSDDFTNRIKAAQSRADLARLTFERYKKLVANMSIPQAQLDQAAAEKKTADADLAAAEQSLKDSVLRAPEDGTILARMVSPAEIVGPGRPVLRFSNLRRMSVDVGVPDTVIGQVHVGQEWPVVFSALPGKSFTGRVGEVGVAGQEGSRLFLVKLKVANPDGLIKSGMTASVSFTPVSRAPAGAVWVPLAALVAAPRADGKEPLAVYVLGNDGKAHRSPVQTDEIAGNRVLVTSGLQAGARVAVAGVGTLFDGALVEATPAPEGFR